MKTAVAAMFASAALSAAAATPVKVDFILNTTDAYGAPVVENRYYYVYRPDGLSTAAPVPMVLVLEASPGSGPATMFNAKAVAMGFVVVSCSFSGNSTGSPGTVWNNDNPRIVSPPVDNVQTSGQPASFWVAATGDAPLAVQWQKNGTNISGANSVWYTVPATAPSDDGATFRAIVSNDAGSATSTVATLTVAAAAPDPRIVASPSDQTVAAGQRVTFPAAATGAPPLVYQWKKDGMDIPGATAASYGASVPVTADCGSTYRVAVSNGVGGVAGVAATLTVLPVADAPVILANPERSRVLTNQSGIFAVRAWSPTPMGYQWQRGPFTGVMTNVPGATGPTCATPPAALSDHLALYRCIVSNPAGPAVSATEMLMVTTAVKAPADITSPVTAAGQVGAPFRYAITASGGTVPLTYTADSLPSGLSVDSATGLISGAPAAAGTNLVTIAATNSAGRTSATLVVTVGLDPPAVPWEAWRAGRFGASALNPAVAGESADPDHDGATNLQEFLADTDPLDPAAGLRLSGIDTAAGQVQLTWVGGTEVRQCLECSGSLLSGPWIPVFTNVPPTPMTNTLTDAGPGSAARFYRIRTTR